MSINVDKNKCVGCYICHDVCPVNAIELKRDQRGFDYPHVNSEKCIECKKCDNVCPIDNRSNKERTKECWAIKNKNSDIRKRSSSGGFFAAIALHVIENRGVVYGCELNDDQRAVYARAETWQECEKFMGSKYVQSDMRGIYNNIKDDLLNNRMVLFTGSPCQCMAIKYNIDTERYKNQLIICEYLCHGAPSPMVFEDFKAHMEKKYNGKIVEFVFRDKERINKKPSCRGIRMKIKTDKAIYDIYNAKENDKYCEMFRCSYIFRESCYNCPCIGYERYADITMGDYWGCEKYHREFFDTQGISIVLLNTEAGQKCFDLIKDKFERISVKESEIVQQMLIEPPKCEADYNKFWDRYYNYGFNKTAKLLVKAIKRKLFLYKLKTKIAGILPAKAIWFIKKVRNKA